MAGGTAQVVDRVDDGNLAPIRGNTHYLARASADKGPVDSAMLMERMQLVLRRSPAKEAALEQFMAEQLDPGSANYHHWLHADEFGKRYGPADTDIAAVTGWLQAHGFKIDSVSKGRTTIEFSGTAGQVTEAFHAEIHRYLVDGAMHIANDRDPQIPKALLPAVIGVASLHDFTPKHQLVRGRAVTMSGTTHRVSPHSSGLQAAPQYVFPDPKLGGAQNEDVGPNDFAAIYNLTPAWTAGITGKGVSIAIAAESDINAADVDTFRKFFGLSNYSGTVTQVLNGPDPGIVEDRLIADTADAEWAGAAAPDANVLVVVSKATATSAASLLSISYIIDQELAPVASFGFSQCEFALGDAGNANLIALYQQGAAEGMSVFASAGDYGSTSCDDSNGDTYPALATMGYQVNGFASSTYVMAVGGTDFDWQQNPSQFWGANNANNASALGYIPETPWNPTCSSYYLIANVYPSETTPYHLCAYAGTQGLNDLLRVVGGGGGRSSCLTNTGTLASCKGSGRELPDLSLFASSGMAEGLAGSAYIICVSAVSPDSTCDYSGDDLTSQEAGGTSIASSAMAGIMALVVQRTGAPRGLPRTILNQLEGAFHDITTGTNAMPCAYDSLDCGGGPGPGVTTLTTGAGMEAYVYTYRAGNGFDMATGMGSVNATNIVNEWPTPAVLISDQAIAFGPQATGTASAPKVVTIASNGKEPLTISSITLSGSQQDDFVLTNNCPSVLGSPGDCTFSVVFQPVAPGTKSGGVRIVDNASGVLQKVSLSGTATAPNAAALTLSTTSVEFPATVAGKTSIDQPIVLTNTGGSPLTIGSIVLLGADPASFVDVSSCGATLAASASCTVYAAFTPPTTGAQSAALSVTDNAYGSPQKIALNGTGTVAPSVTLSATTLAFSPQSVGTESAAKSITITNTGIATLTLSAIYVTGSQTDDFEMLNNCGPSLAAGAGCTVYVAFKPVATGSKAAGLSINDSGGSSPQKVTLTGTGIS